MLESMGRGGLGGRTYLSRWERGVIATGEGSIIQFLFPIDKIVINKRVMPIVFFAQSPFLEAELLYKPLCPSVGRLVGWSVGRGRLGAVYFFDAITAKLLDRF